MLTIHLISHTHWDREWYRTFQQFRLRLVHLVDGLLDMLTKDRDFKYFMLDGQTIILDDYLQMRPEAESVLQEHIREGRLLIGPWHILPDMFLVSPEAHIRNLLAGDREARRFGPKMMIGYMPDSFGHIGQMPQILRGFGIDNACLWRGLDDQPAEFWWQAPDGSRVLMLYMRDSYSNGANLNAREPAQFAGQIEKAAGSLAPHSSAADLLVMFGTDHMEPPGETSGAIMAANKALTDYRIVHSTLPSYLASIQSGFSANGRQIPTVGGELRSSKRSHLLPGVLSTRIWIKQRNHACENLLEKWAEPFSTFASLIMTGEQRTSKLAHPAPILRQAWQLLMECHPHDSICGCSIDQVHEEMRPRFDQVEQIGEEVTGQSLEALSEAIDTAAHMPVEASSAIIVFNPLSSPRTDVVTTEISLPPGVSDFELVDETGNILLHQSASGSPTDLINVRVRREELGGMLAMVNEGRAGNLAIQDMRLERTGTELRVEAIFSETAGPRLDVWDYSMKALQEYLKDPAIKSFHIHARSPDSARVTFAATGVPALGWKAFHIRPRESTPFEIRITPIMRLLAPLATLPIVPKLVERISRRTARPPYIIQNDSLSVELDASDLTLTVTVKRTGRKYQGLNRFMDGGDCGDEYNFCPPPKDSIQYLPALRGVTIVSGPVQQKIIARLSLSVPEGLSADRKSRSKQMANLLITTVVTLTNSVPRVDIHTQVDNRARDHRLRVHFPVAGQMVETAEYDGHFEIVKRPTHVSAFDSTWIEQPRPEVPQRAFTSIADGHDTFTVANRGIPEAEVTEGASGPEIALTLLRCIGWLSRDDFTTRKGHAGPFLETPGAQMQGEWEFDYSIIAGQIREPSHRQAWSFDSPLRAAPTGIRTGALPSSGSIVSVGDPSFMVTAVKKAQDETGWIVRGYNISDEGISVSLKPWRPFGKVEQVNMAEEMVTPLIARASGEVTVEARGHEVITVRLSE